MLININLETKRNGKNILFIHFKCHDYFLTRQLTILYSIIILGTWSFSLRQQCDFKSHLQLFYVKSLCVWSPIIQKLRKENKTRETYGDVCVSKMFIGRHIRQMFYRGTNFIFDCVVVKKFPLHHCNQRALSHLSYL